MALRDDLRALWRKHWGKSVEVLYREKYRGGFPTWEAHVIDEIINVLEHPETVTALPSELPGFLLERWKL